MKRTRTEFRITIKRAGREPRTVIRCSEASARKFLQLLGPEPWKVYAPIEDDGDGLVCCSGQYCGCGGQTWREQADAKRKEYTPLQWVRVESRLRTWELTHWDAPELTDATLQVLLNVQTHSDEPDAKWDGFKVGEIQTTPEGA